MGTVRFILGRAATGKTHHLIGQIAALCRADPLGPPIYWLLPKQATFQAERLLVAELGGFARVRVVDFGKLGQAVLDACGDVGLPEVTAAGRRMVIGHLLRANRKRLRYYGRAAHRAGLAAELDATFAEFERARLDVAGLDRLLADLDPVADPSVDALRQKLDDVRLLLAAYTDYTAGKLDPAERLKRVLDRAAGCPAFADATLFVDDFYDFTVYERTLLAAVAGAVSRTEVAVLLDPDDPAAIEPNLPPSDLSIFHRTLRAYRGLRAAMKGLTIAPPLVLRDVHRPPPLAAVERALFTPATAPASAVEFTDAPDARAEVDAVARQIRAATADGTTRYRDVAVLVRSLPDYREIVHASFAEHGIPYFADARRSATHHPLLQAVRAALLIVRSGWPTDAVLTLAKSGLAGLNDDDADALENYVLEHRVRGPKAWLAPWAFTPRTLTRGADDSAPPSPTAATVDGSRRKLVDGLAPLLGLPAAGETVRGIAAAVFASLEAFHAPETLVRWMAEADGERRAEHEQVWAELVGLFEQMVDVTGDEVMTAGEFLDVLDAGLEGFDFALPPPMVDQVLLGDADRTRTAGVKRAFVLGLADGRFPVARREELVLSDAERRSLRKRDVELDADAERQLLDERFLAYVAFTRAAGRLSVSRPLADAAGRAVAPSPFWYELQRLGPAEPTHAPRAGSTDPAAIGTPRQLVDGLMRWVRTGAAAGDGTWPALYQWFAGLPEDDSSPVGRLRTLAWPALSYANAAALDPARAAALFPTPLRATVAQLEDVAACPFRHFARHGLRLAGRPSADVTGLDLHHAYHEVIEHLTRDLLARQADWVGLDAAATAELIAEHVAEVGRRFRDEVLLSTARNRYLLAHVERTLARAVATLAEGHRRGRFRPARADVRFGPGGDLPEHVVRTPAGHEVHVRGRIDRVDLSDGDDGSQFVVSDYRLSPGPLSLDKVYYGLSLQLLTYVLVVRDAGQRLFRRPVFPAAAFVNGLLHPPASLDHPADAEPTPAERHLRAKPRGLIHEHALDALDRDLTDGHSKVVAAYRKRDGTPGHRHATDVALAGEFEAILSLVEARLGEAADRIVAGTVAVQPYRLGRLTPCGRCEYRSVCRFEPGVNAYRTLQPIPRLEVLAALTGTGPTEPG